MIAIEVMNIRRIVIGSLVMKVREIMKIATRLMWIPGIRPVRIPARMPRMKDRIIEIMCSRLGSFYPL